MEVGKWSITLFFRTGSAVNRAQSYYQVDKQYHFFYHTKLMVWTEESCYEQQEAIEAVAFLCDLTLRSVPLAYSPEGRLENESIHDHQQFCS